MPEADTPAPAPAAIALCRSTDLVERGLGVAFEVLHDGQRLRSFAVRYQGQARAYLNRCTHVALELDFKPNHFFDGTGEWLICAAHGALYRPSDGRWVGGPGCGALTPVTVSEQAGAVYWHPCARIRPVTELESK